MHWRCSKSAVFHGQVPEAMQAAPNPTSLNEPPYMKPYLKPSRSDPTLLSSYGDDMVAMNRPLYNHAMKPPGVPQMPVTPMMPPPPSQAAAAHAAAAAAAGQSTSKPDCALAALAALAA